MAVERKWLTVLATPFTANGSATGVVTIADTTGFKVKGAAYIVANGLPPLELQIQRVLSPTQLIVGPPRAVPNPAIFTDISSYTVAANAMIGFAEQSKNLIKPEDVVTATYESDPTVAWRTVLVDQYGNFYGKNNPIPISFDGTVSIGIVQVEGTNGNTIEPNENGSINVVPTGTVAKTPQIYNIPVMNANTEIAQPIPDNTNKIEIKVRNSAATLQFAFISGQSGSNYSLIPRGASYYIDNILTTGLSIYFQTNNPNQVVEILTWS